MDPPDDPLEDEPPEDDPLEDPLDEPLGDELNGELPEPVDWLPGDKGRTPEGVLLLGPPRSDSTPAGAGEPRGWVPDWMVLSGLVSKPEPGALTLPFRRVSHPRPRP